ncbi:ABC transporter ATP-binding protein [Leptospira bourretii]|uniref:ABC transporter ATP-binding protein n=1 Tax=Leptospira bourretii TaxID=2484962 RepID=A0A4V3JLT8_9LEPT|nr:ABC transporter ATP-binding protein [Leptospira bourretii]TGK85982.1 ABC transporter ATP-binding protein [Leptospira bourretii]TGK94880.1 ABC transporter ATP-binding protein [Leptospira bourretii]TGL25234.1 ABC transporter ATP-binding protein [Leptospira bourretii]TGL39693.1 ABC transporter ATP-binding protein [Leptospira bourretii]
MLEFKNVFKSFHNESETIDVLKNISFRIETGEFVAIIGPSGSGKSTLLGVAAGLDKPDTGVVALDGIDLTKENESNLADLRADKIGFIFQNFQLLPGLNAIENVGIPLYLKSSLTEAEILKKSEKILESVAMSHRATHFPKQLSGGEEQRIAIARSFVNDPKVIFADEPTANLDFKNSKTVLDLLLYRNKEQGTTLVVVTHDPDVAKLADRVLEMKDGEIISDSRNKNNGKKNSSKKLTSKKTTKQKKTTGLVKKVSR